MGLRDFLNGMNQFSEGAQAFGKGASDIRKQTLRDKFNEEAPSLMRDAQSEDPTIKNTALSRIQKYSSSGAVDKSDPVYEQLVKIALPTKAASQPLADVDNQYSYVPQNIRDAVKKEKDPSVQQKILGDYISYQKGKETSGKKDQKLSYDQGKFAVTKLDKIETAFRDEDYKLKTVQDALKNNTSLGDNIAFGYIARSVAQEKGPLSDTDIKRIQGITGIEGNIDQFRARFTGETYQTLSKDQKAEVEKIIKQSAERFGERRAEAMAQELTSLHSISDQLRDEDGMPAGVLKQTLARAKKQGIPIDYDSETGSYTVKKPSQNFSGVVGELIGKAGGIKNEKIKNAFIEQLKSKGQLSPEEEQKARSNIQKYLEQK